MINAIRTLLMNATAHLAQSSVAPAYVPPDFRPQPAPAGLGAVRQVLFGTDPDPSGLQYSAYLLLRCIDGSDLRRYLTELDSRITYDLEELAASVRSLVRRPAFAGFEVSGHEITSTAGRVLRPFQVSTADGVTVSVTDLRTGFTAGPWSAPAPLGDTGYSVSPLASGAYSATGSWYAIARNPLGDAVGIVADHLGGESVYALFGAETGPYGDFAKSFRSGNLCEAAAGIALALAYRTAGVP